MARIPSLLERVVMQRRSRRPVHPMSENWDHYGGKEVRDGETVQWNANWERGAAVFDVSAVLRRLVKVLLHIVFMVMAAQVRFIIVKRPGMASTVTETETTYYDEDGTKLGSSWSGSSTWQDGDGNTITNASTNYSGPDWEWLGARGPIRTRMVMFYQAALILRPLLKSMNSMVLRLLPRGHHLHRNLPGFRMLMVH